MTQKEMPGGTPPACELLPGEGEPLAARMRPRTLDEFVGQDHIVAPGRLLRRAIQADQLSSLIFYGPPGTGKTTLAAVIANTTRSRFVTLNAVLTGVKDLREAVRQARDRMGSHGQRTILFVDEVHRWNKAQQDGLLPWVENGTVILIGATTENPYFSVNPPLVSRSRIFQLKRLTEEDLRTIARRALSDPERGYGRRRVRIEPDALDHIVDVANGDARGVLNALELAVETTPTGAEGVIVVNLAVAEDSIQRRAVFYDRDGDVHYDTISAFIKSLRGSDPDAAFYWLARMVYAGEDPRFIFRRMLILAGEDVGLADPEAVRVVTACAEAFDRVGLPEGRFHLAQAALYLATAPKSNSVMGFFDALSAVEKEAEEQVPSHLKDASRDKKGFGHGEGYLYPHAYRDHWVAQQYLPDTLQGNVFYVPSDQGREKDIALRVARRREAQVTAMVEGVAAAPPEVLSFSPADRARERWLQRAISQAGRELGRVRDRIVAAGAIERHHVVLDLNGATGLLTWEALRRAPEGGVWVLVTDRQTARALEAQALRLPEADRPFLLAGPLEAVGALVAARGQGHVRFDRALGRNALLGCRDKTAALKAVAAVLRAGAVLSMAETVPRGGQRVYRLVARELAGEALFNKWRDAEEAIYAEPHDPMVNWDASVFEAAVASAGLEQGTVQEEQGATHILVTETVLSRWFPVSDHRPAAGRPSYRERLRRLLSEDEVERVRAILTGALLGTEVGWQSTVVYVTARAPK